MAESSGATCNKNVIPVIVLWKVNLSWRSHITVLAETQLTHLSLTPTEHITVTCSC